MISTEVSPIVYQKTPCRPSRCRASPPLDHEYPPLRTKPSRSGPRRGNRSTSRRTRGCGLQPLHGRGDVLEAHEGIHATLGGAPSVRVPLVRSVASPNGDRIVATEAGLVRRIRGAVWLRRGQESDDLDVLATIPARRSASAFHQPVKCVGHGGANARRGPRGAGLRGLTVSTLRPRGPRSAAPAQKMRGSGFEPAPGCSPRGLRRRRPLATVLCPARSAATSSPPCL